MRRWHRERKSIAEEGEGEGEGEGEDGEGEEDEASAAIREALEAAGRSGAVRR